MATKGSLSALSMEPVSEDELAATRGGRGHGEYDGFLAQFIEAKIRGTKVAFNGVQPNSVKTGLKNAIGRAVEAGTIEKDQVEVRGKDQNVYLLNSAIEAA